jgi:prevent-host-death family protein
MEMVGVKELKNKLTYYLKLTKAGDSIIVTNRGAPVAIMHSLDSMENRAGLEEILGSLAKRGMIRLPRKQKKITAFRAAEATGQPASDLIIEERR